MIAEFPHCTPITIDILPDFNRITSRHPPYSDFNFVSLMSWSANGQGLVSTLYDNLVIMFPGYSQDEHIVSFLGDNRVVTTAQTVLSFAEKKLATSRLQLIPEVVATILQKHNSWQVMEDLDNNDYVVSLSLLAEKTGPGLRRFRRAVATYEREYGVKTKLEILNLTDATTRAAIIEVFMHRVLARADIAFMRELRALKNLLLNAQYFDTIGYGLVIHGALKAFIICEKTGDDWSVGHFWKADTNHAGIYSYLMLLTARELLSQGITKMNIEQDLGIESLRFFKQSLNPVGHLRKYVVRRPTFQPAKVVRRERSADQLVYPE